VRDPINDCIQNQMTSAAPVKAARSAKPPRPAACYFEDQLGLPGTAHLGAANALLIVSSAIIDLLAIFLLSRWVFGGSLRPSSAWLWCWGSVKSCRLWSPCPRLRMRYGAIRDSLRRS
jgi:hypothetical protein